MRRRTEVRPVGAAADGDRDADLEADDPGLEEPAAAARLERRLRRRVQAGDGAPRGGDAPPPATRGYGVVRLRPRRRRKAGSRTACRRSLPTAPDHCATSARAAASIGTSAPGRLRLRARSTAVRRTSVTSTSSTRTTNADGISDPRTRRRGPSKSWTPRRASVTRSGGAAVGRASPSAIAAESWVAIAPGPTAVSAARTSAMCSHTICCAQLGAVAASSGMASRPWRGDTRSPRPTAARSWDLVSPAASASPTRTGPEPNAAANARTVACGREVSGTEGRWPTTEPARPGRPQPALR